MVVVSIFRLQRGSSESRGASTDLQIYLTYLLSENYHFFFKDLLRQLYYWSGTMFDTTLDDTMDEDLMQSYEWDGDVTLGVTHEMPA